LEKVSKDFYHPKIIMPIMARPVLRKMIISRNKNKCSKRKKKKWRLRKKKENSSISK